MLGLLCILVNDTVNPSICCDTRVTAAARVADAPIAQGRSNMEYIDVLLAGQIANKN